MFNLNTPPSSLLGIDGSGLCSTPKTPEIVNSLIAMTTNPMDNYNFSALNGNNSAVSTPGSGVAARSFNPNAQSQDSSHSSSSASPLDSPAGTNTTPSVQQTCSQLIKAGLKLSIQSKRKHSTCDSSSGSDQPMSKCSRRDEDCDDSSDEECDSKTIAKGLTPEDEDRRRRRRERNKIAATKCRMKKRERTQNLIKESEQLETQNIDLKSQVRNLETERRQLLEMLQSHTPACVHRGGLNLPSKLLTSPAHKYLAALELEENTSHTANSSNASTPSNGAQTIQQQLQHALTPRTAIPPVSTINVSRNNGFKAAAVLQQLPNQSIAPLPNGYCKPSPTAAELGYLNSPSQENMCLPSMLPQEQASNPTVLSVMPGPATVSPQLSDYIPNCDNQLALGLGHPTNATQSNCNGDTSALLSGMVSPLTVGVSTPTTATEFVKNELVDSQSPYTTAQSAERFLFESNCDTYVDIKHAVSLHHGNHNNNNNNNNNSIVSLNNNNNSNNGNNNLLDFHSSLLGGGTNIGSFHDQITIKNDYLPDSDFLAQLTGGEFVDLDANVTTPFMTHNGCLA